MPRPVEKVKKNVYGIIVPYISSGIFNPIKSIAVANVSRAMRVI